MREVFAVPGLRDDLAGGAIDLLRLDAWPRPRDAGALRFAHDVHDTAELGRG